MAYPIALAIAAATTAASTGLQMAGQAKARSAQERASNAELLRQNEYQRQAQQVADESLAQSTRGKADEQIQQGTDARRAAYARITNPPTQTAAATPAPVNRTVTTTGPTATANARSTALTQAWNRILGNAQSRIGGYDDWGLAQAIKNQRAGQRLGQIAGNARGSANVLPAELEYASHAGDSLNSLAGILGAIGSVAGTYAATTPRATPINPALGGVDIVNPAYLNYMAGHA